MRRLIVLVFCFSFASCASNDWLYEVNDVAPSTPMNTKEPIYVSNVGHYDSESTTTENQSLWSHIQNIGNFEENITEARDSNDFVEVKVISNDSLQFCLFQSNEPVDTIVYTGNFQRDVFQTDRVRELIPFYPIFYRKRIKTGTFYVDQESKFRLNSKSWSEGLFLIIIGGSGGGTMKTTYQLIADPFE